MKTNKTQITPLPWQVGKSVNHIGVTIWRTDGDGVGYERICRNVSSHNADFIVRACNALPDCIAALEAALRELGRLGADTNSADIGPNQVVLQVQAAIAKAVDKPKPKEQQ